jgi:dolichol-phosphate mannosyltransferase
MIAVIATYNESETIGQIVESLARDFKGVVVVDDSSPDGTALIAERAGATVISRPPKSGIASAYMDGFRYALTRDPRLVLQMDAGLTHDPQDAPLISWCNQVYDYDLVIGSRFCEGYPFLGFRTVISRSAALLMRAAGVRVSDVTSGFRAWEPGLLEAVIEPGVESEGFAFQLELLHRASEMGARITEFPIEYKLTNSSFDVGMIAEALNIWRKCVIFHNTKGL